MLFLEKTDVKKIGEICEGIANGSRVLSAENVVLLDAFHSRLKSIMGIKVGEIARAFYTLNLFSEQIKKHKKELEDKKKEVDSLEQKIKELEQACQPKGY